METKKTTKPKGDFSTYVALTQSRAKAASKTAKVQEPKKATKSTEVAKKGTQAVVATSGNEVLMLALRESSGPKNSVEIVTAAVALFKMTTMTRENFKIFFFSFKKMPLDQVNFEKITKNSMALASTYLKSVNQNPDESAPVVLYKKRKEELKELLKPIWKRVKTDTDKKALTWGTWLRIPFVEKNVKAVKEASQRIKPDAPSALFSNAYWAIADLDVNITEVERRHVFVYELIVRGFNHKIVLDERGNIMQLPKSVPIEHERDELKGLKLPTADEFEGLQVMPTSAILDIALLIKVRKLFQSRDIRMSRKDSTDNEERIAKVAQQMLYVINMMKILQGEPQLLEVQMNMDKNSDFSKLYFKAYQYVHTYIRTFKRIVFGSNRGGANTRATDFSTNVVVSIKEEKAFNRNLSILKNGGVKVSIATEQVDATEIPSLVDTAEETNEDADQDDDAEPTDLATVEEVVEGSEYENISTDKDEAQ